MDRRLEILMKTLENRELKTDELYDKMAIMKPITGLGRRRTKYLTEHAIKEGYIYARKDRNGAKYYGLYGVDYNLLHRKQNMFEKYVKQILIENYIKELKL